MQNLQKYFTTNKLSKQCIHVHIATLSCIEKGYKYNIIIITYLFEFSSMYLLRSSSLLVASSMRRFCSLVLISSM